VGLGDLSDRLGRVSDLPDHQEALIASMSRWVEGKGFGPVQRPDDDSTVSVAASETIRAIASHQSKKIWATIRVAHRTRAQPRHEIAAKGYCQPCLNPNRVNTSIRRMRLRNYPRFALYGLAQTFNVYQ
jgi:hypothetical protein